MPREKTPDRPPELRLSPPELWRLEFARKEPAGEVDESTELPLVFGLALNRVAVNKLGIELSVELKDFPPLTILVAYRSVFELDSTETGAALERDLKHIAAQVGPAALYPYVREAVSSTVARAGLPPLVPPIVNFRNVFDPDEVTLPAAPESDATSGE